MKKKLIVSHCGHTLFELIIVCALVALCVCLVMPELWFLQSCAVKTELQGIQEACSYLQHYAQATNETQTLAFDLSRNSYSFNGHTIVLAKGVRFGVLDGTKGPPSSPTNAIRNPVTFQQQCITFTPQGIVQPGTVYLVDAHKRTMCALSCAVSSVSYLRKYRYAGTWCRIA